MYVYGLKDPRFFHPRYVGITKNELKVRLKHHCKSKGTNHKANWIRTLIRAGLKPEIFVIEEVADERTAKEREIYWIAYLKAQGYRLTNSTDGGGGCLNPSEETRIKLRARFIGNKFACGNKGIKKEKDHKIKIGLGNKGKVRTKEVRNRIRLSLLGKKPTPETRRNLSLAKIGNTNSKGKIRSEQFRNKVSKTLKGKYTGERGSRSKLKDYQRLEILRLHSKGNSTSKIALLYNVCVRTIRNALSYLKRYNKEFFTMSSFNVSLETIEKIWDHPNADKIQLAKVTGKLLQFVIKKNEFFEKENVIFFPIDSVLPDSLVNFFGISNFLSGKNKNRIRTATIRGEISQGYVAPVAEVLKYLKTDTLPEDLTAAMGVMKYEPPEIKISAGNLVRRPEHVPVYDIEGCDNYPHIVDMLMDIPCVVTEKMEGSNAWATMDSDKKISVGQKNYAIENLVEGPEHSFWTVMRRDGVIGALDRLSEIYGGSPVTIRSEMVGPGIQGNYYRLKQLMCFVYDIQVATKYVSYTDLEPLLSEIGLTDKFVPVLAKGITLREWLAGRSIQQAANGVSAWNPTKENLALYDIKKDQMGVCKIREGIVIKPMVEQDIVGFGRLFLKQRDPVYLDKTGN